ncbi:hypothetical protein HN51_032473 [Arachis hypogaea]
MLPAIEKFMLKLTEKKPKIESKKEKEYRKTRMELKRQREEELKAMKEKRKELERAKKIPLEMEEIVKFFNHEEIYRRRGVKIPGGILLCDPPGVEKTLLAKAVAGEAGVNFFFIFASQFVEIYVGASRVRALYPEARENAPSVVFIDELDAVGKERGLIRGSGGQECDATLNQLLMCLDGFEGRGEVITIASTNRPDILDPALVRPGRFDRKIFIPKPGFIGRIEILKVHAQKKANGRRCGLFCCCYHTTNCGLHTFIYCFSLWQITTDGLLQAAQMEERGILDKKERSMETWKQVAINEAAMAVVAMNFSDIKNIGSQLLPELVGNWVMCG